MSNKVNDIYPDKWINGNNLQGEEKVTISKVRVETFGEQNKIVLGFDQMVKELPLNKTNAKTMEKITGKDDYSQWVNTEVVLYSVDLIMAGRPEKGVRIKALEKPAEEKSSADNDQNLLDEVFRRNA
jgi:hypothetical protein